MELGISELKDKLILTLKKKFHTKYGRKVIINDMFLAIASYEGCNTFYKPP